MLHCARASLLTLGGILLAPPARAQDCPSPTGRHVRDVGSRNPDGTSANGYRVANRVTVSREDATACLELTFASARAKATTLATLAKQTLGDALCVSESAVRDYSTANFVRTALPDGAASVESGTAITFAVDVVFALK